MTNRGWLRRNKARHILSEQPLVSSEDEFEWAPPEEADNIASKKARPAIEHVWGRVNTLTQASTIRRSRANDSEFPTLSTSPKTPDQISAGNRKITAQSSVKSGSIRESDPTRATIREGNALETHPIVSQKKAKKVQREAKRKAKKVGTPEKVDGPIVMEVAGEGATAEDCLPTSMSTSVFAGIPDTMGDSHQLDPESFAERLIENEDGDASIVAGEQTSVLSASSSSSDPTTLRTSHSKHDHWLRFLREFKVDQLTIPYLRPSDNCSHESPCSFESQGIPDCPFHEPRKCPRPQHQQ